MFADWDICVGITFIWLELNDNDAILYSKSSQISAAFIDRLTWEFCSFLYKLQTFMEEDKQETFFTN